MEEIKRKVIAAYPACYLRGYAHLKMRTTPYPEIAAFLPREGTIVELGCGYGFLANYLWFDSPARHIVGVDLDGVKIRRALSTVGERRGIEFLDMDFRQCPVARFDGVVLVDFLHHISYSAQEELLRTIHERLSPGGRLAIRETSTEPRLKYLLNYVSDLVLYPFAEKCRFRSSAEFTTLLGTIGFQTSSVPDSGGLFACVRYECVKS